MMAALIRIGCWRNEQHPELPDPHDFIDDGWYAEERDQVADYLACECRKRRPWVLTYSDAS